MIKHKIKNILKKCFPYIEENRQSFRYIPKEEIKAPIKKTIYISDDIIRNLDNNTDKEIIDFLVEAHENNLAGKRKEFFTKLIKLKGLSFIYKNIEIIEDKSLKIIVLILIKNKNSLTLFLKNAIKINNKSFNIITKYVFLATSGALQEDEIINLLKSDNFNLKQKQDIFNNLLFINTGISSNAEIIIINQATKLFGLNYIISQVKKNTSNKNTGIFFNNFFDFYDKDTREESLKHFLKLLKTKDNNFEKTIEILGGIKNLFETDNLDMAYLYDIDPKLLIDYTSILSTNFGEVEEKNLKNNLKNGYNKYVS